MCNVLHHHISFSMQGFGETHLHHYGGHWSLQCLALTWQQQKCHPQHLYQAMESVKGR